MILNDLSVINGLKICVVTALIGFTVLSYQVYVQHNKPSWVHIEARLLDANVIQIKHDLEQGDALNELIIHYVYQFIWGHQTYLNYDLIRTPKTFTDRITSEELRYQLLSAYWQTDKGFLIWVNPLNPYESSVIPPL